MVLGIWIQERALVVCQFPLNRNQVLCRLHRHLLLPGLLPHLPIFGVPV